LHRRGEVRSVSLWKPPQYQHFSGVEAQKFRENGKHLFDPPPASRCTIDGKTFIARTRQRHCYAKAGIFDTSLTISLGRKTKKSC